MLTNLFLKILEYGIIYGVNFLVNSKNPKLGVPKKLAKVLVTAVGNSTLNNTTDDMFKEALEVLDKEE